MSTTISPFEAGLPLPEASTTANSPLPPGSGKLAVPHFTSFTSIVNAISRTYRYSHDEAIRHSRTNALAMRRDLSVMDALRSRQMPTSQLSWHLEASNEQDETEKDAVAGLTEILKATPRWQGLLMNLLEALWYGRAGSQVTYTWDFSTGKKRMVVRSHLPINGDKLVFKFSGEPGLLVHAAYPGETITSDRGRVHLFTPEEREQVLIHKHEIEDVDFYDGELAGGIHGVGIRSRLYWFWWLRSQVMAWLMDYLERVGAGGFTIYYYEQGNPKSLEEVEAAAKEQWRNNTILFPRGRTENGAGVERIETSNAGASLLQNLVENWFDNVIRRYVLGQTLSSESAGTGLGSGVADFQASTLSRIIKYDAVNLQETLTSDLLSVLCKYNYPSVQGRIRFVFDVDKPNVQDTLAAARAFFEMGGTLDADGLRSVLGLAKPKPGAQVLSKIQPMSPAGLPGPPQGVPMMGDQGPEMPGDGAAGMPQDPNALLG